MKYWNKRKEVREKYWYKVAMPVDATTKKLGGIFGIKHILTKLNSPGKFFIKSSEQTGNWRWKTPDPYFTIWFEIEKDAIFFKLKYA